MLSFIGLFFLKKNNFLKTTVVFDSKNNVDSSCRADKIITNVYDIYGNLKLKFKSSQIQYFEDQKRVWILYPQIFILNKYNIPIFEISCNQAILSHKKLLILKGYVFINKKLNKKYTESVITNRATINLIDQVIISKKHVIIHSNDFYSVGSNLYIDLKTQTIKLFGTIYTRYEIKKN